MSSIPVISTAKNINSRIREYVSRQFSGDEPIFLTKREDVLSYLKYELPELVIYNLSDGQITIRGVLDEVLKDPWILYGGIIGIYKGSLDPEFEAYLKQFNCISLIPEYDLDFSFPRALRIIRQNRNILFHRDLYNKLFDSINGAFVIDNDPFDIKTYANLLTNYLFNSDFINKDSRDRLQVSLMELLMNAIEHGNCRISYEEKSSWLKDHNDIFELIREKNRNPEIARRKVRFNYHITTDHSSFSICDEGEGFDWQSVICKSDSRVNLGKHGHGIRMSNYYMGGLEYNETGNCVSFRIMHQKDEVNIVPGILRGQKERIFNDGEVVFTENEDSNYLYYIVSGTFDVTSKGKHLSTLTTADMFLGEMSFLINNRRSATVTSRGRSILLKISKVDFVNLIRRNPHYGLFLARLLAQRLSRLNEYIAKM
ncbi:cyclic nucleotide-binding domain-containing protein [Marispirochaeta aestuarii]|uniref:cyclic nucleotide-binding domain-containing protein n=1 Tax=Marispirochaeta aestuarii TaxID=1963862 RepID=UPI0029C937B7|nr:cyclic nucleotide-binding domain-containing protein [Marispirochaeta aestuarii]